MSETTVRLQPDVEEGLEALAGKLHRTRSCLINQAVHTWLRSWGATDELLTPKVGR